MIPAEDNRESPPDHFLPEVKNEINRNLKTLDQE